MASVPVKCHCGALTGKIETTAKDPGNRAVCYCDDCQAFARYLEVDDRVLDEHGGSDVFQIAPTYFTIDQGQEHIACVRLNAKGLMRWYASCCNTPLGNTMPTPGIAFIGIPTGCLDADDKSGSLDEMIGPVAFRVHGRFAQGDISHLDAYDKAPLSLFFGVAGKLLKRRLRGDHKPHPFFNDDGSPIAAPKVLSEEERSALG